MSNKLQQQITSKLKTLPSFPQKVYYVNYLLSTNRIKQPLYSILITYIYSNQ